MQQIAKLGLMQVTSLVYAILACGVAAKYSRSMSLQAGKAPIYSWDDLVRDYGAWLFIVIIGWTLAASYYSSPARFPSKPSWLVAAALIFVALVFLASSFIATAALMVTIQPPVALHG